MSLPKWIEDWSNAPHCDECDTPNRSNIKTKKVFDALSITIEALEYSCEHSRLECTGDCAHEKRYEALARIEKLGDK